MRIKLARALFSMALVCAGGLAHAQYPSPTLATADSNSGSYFAQGPTSSPYASNYLTSSQEPSPTAASPAMPAMPCDDSWCKWDDCCDPYGNWRDNTLLWIGGEGYKTIGDTFDGATPPGFMNSGGLVGGFNTGFRLFADSPIRGQVGASYGVYDLKGRDTVVESQSSAEQQTFFTFGITKRSDVLNGDRLCWGAVYDQFWAHQWGVFASELYVGQVRGIIGWAFNECHEVGFWGAFRTTGDDSVAPLSPPAMRAMNQYNLYWRYNWAFGGQTMLYVGANDSADIGDWLFGLLGQAPLSDNFGLYGNFTFDFPGAPAGTAGSNEHEWNFGAGLVWYLGGKAVSPSVSGPQGLPLLPVANNGSFLITN